MILDLRSVFANENISLPVKYELDMSEVDFYGYFPLIKPVKVEGKVYNRAGIVNLSVVCKAEYVSPCDRCGKETTKLYNIPIERVLVSEKNTYENDEIVLVQDMKLDLEELIFTETVLGIGSKHLCSENCKGLCPKCGKNLNDGPCGCTDKVIDPRLQKLAELLEK